MQTDLIALRQLYCTLMREIKLRLGTISFTLEGKNPLPAFSAFEFCYLQFRMICETLALACLAAHGDIQATKTKEFREAYEADWILRRLEKLHPNFYPEPITMKHVRNNLYVASDPEPGAYLKKRELVALYGKSGAALHRGDMSTIRNPLRTDFDTVLELHDKIGRLLVQHKVSLSDGQKLLVTLSCIEHGGEVFAVLSHEVGRGKVVRQPS